MPRQDLGRPTLSAKIDKLEVRSLAVIAVIFGLGRSGVIN
jgi:hypothetical protein